MNVNREYVLAVVVVFLVVSLTVLDAIFHLD